jgi:hypothetical protein
MTVYRPYLQTNLFHLFIGVLAPAGLISAFVFLVRGPYFPGRLYLLISFPIMAAGGLYYLFAHCVWVLICDEEKNILHFYKTTRKVILRVRELKELSVFKTFRGFDYRFKTSIRQITIEEMDGMHELVAYIRKVNPQINVSSPEDHTLF